jgi:hypothetical protein
VVGFLVQQAELVQVVKVMLVVPVRNQVTDLQVELAVAWLAVAVVLPIKTIELV